MTSVELNRSVHRFVRLICCKVIIKFIVVAIVSSAVSWTMVNWNNNYYDEQIRINQRWAGDRLPGFVKAACPKECSCSMMLIAG